MAHIVIDPRGIRPVGFDGDEGEILLLDEGARDRLPHAIEFRGSVACLAKENHFRLADPAKERGQVHLLDRGKRSARSYDAVGKLAFGCWSLRHGPRERGKLASLWKPALLA